MFPLFLDEGSGEGAETAVVVTYEALEEKQPPASALYLPTPQHPTPQSPIELLQVGDFHILQSLPASCEILLVPPVHSNLSFLQLLSEPLPPEVICSDS